MSVSPPTGGGTVIFGRRVSQLWLDIAIAATLALIGTLEALRQVSIPAGADIGEVLVTLAPVWMMLLVTLSLAVRRYLPMSVLIITATGLVSSQVLDDSGAGWVALIIAGFSAGMQGPPRRAVVVGFAVMTVINVTMWLTVFGRREFDPILPGLVLLAAGFFWAGSVLRARTRQAADLRAHTVRLELEREREAERAAAAERTRIARELHDVIAHSLSVMVIQTAAARRVLDDDPRRAREALDAVEETGRTAMVEMRRLLGVVRRDEADSAAPRAPQPSLDNLERLVDDMRQAGLNVSLAIEGEPEHLPPGVDVSAYRIVQEALTNALRHAPGAATEVTVRYRASAVELDVADDGGGRVVRKPQPMTGASTTGHGLVGMRERVALLRGQLEVGPRAEGGFRVFARLPLSVG